MAEPLVSVIMPVYNNAATLEAAARSVLRQTVSNLELLIIDDGSQDDSYAVAARLRDPRIRLFRNDRNLGAAATRNRGIACMRGDYMAPMDADDVCERRRLELTLDVLQRHPATGICGGWTLWQGWGPVSFVGRLPCGPAAVRAYLLYGMPSAHDALLFRAALLRRHGLRYAEDLRAAEDYDLYVRCAEVADLDNVPAVLVRYRFNPRGITSTRGLEATRRRVAQLRTYLLRLLPEGVDDEKLWRHASIGNGAGVVGADALNAARRWLETLDVANRSRAVYDPRGFATATAMVWFCVCRNSAHLGRTAWQAWRTSRWATAYTPAADELRAFFGSWVLAKLRPARRRPQGALSGL